MSTVLEAAKKFYEVYNDKKLDLIDSIFTDDYVGHVNAHDIVGAANAKGFIGGFLEGIPNNKLLRSKLNIIYKKGD